PRISTLGPAGLSGLVIGDFNNDGVPDVASTDFANTQILVALGNGFGGFGPASHISVSPGPLGIVAADFNEDGNVDLAVTYSGAAKVSILVGDGLGAFTPGATLSIPTAAGFAIQVADVNHDTH